METRTKHLRYSLSLNPRLLATSLVHLRGKGYQILSRSDIVNTVLEIFVRATGLPILDERVAIETLAQFGVLPSEKTGANKKIIDGASNEMSQVIKTVTGVDTIKVDKEIPKDSPLYKYNHKKQVDLTGKSNQETNDVKEDGFETKGGLTYKKPKEEGFKAFNGD